MKASPRSARFDLVRLAGGVSVLALAFSSAAAWGQDTIAPEAQTATATETQTGQAETEGDDDATSEEIIVTGIRASLARAQDIKRESDTVVDAITAEDIGALPDRSVNEALQRIPGVAITRFASAEDSQHFSVEGSGVVIRGLSYVKGEFNGRDTFSTSGGREIGFNDVAPELVGSVEVFKNLTADLIEGGIAGTVNINTRKPFDSNDRLIYLSGEINYADLASRSAPTFTGLFSDQWEFGNGSRIGLLVSGTYSRLYSKSDSAFVASPFERFNGTRTFNEGSPYQATVTDTFQCPTGLTSCYAPTGAGVRTQDFDRERYGISAALQYANPDDSIVATAQFLRTNGKNSWTEHTIEPNVYYADVNATFPAPGTSYTFDDNGVFVSGQIRRPGGFKEGRAPGRRFPAGTRGSGFFDLDGTGPGQPVEGFFDQSNGLIYGVLPNFQEGGIFTTFSNRGYITEYQTDDYSLNLKLAPTDRFRLNLDAQYVKARATELDSIVDTGTWSNIDLDVSGEIPQIDFSIGQVPAYGRAPSVEEYFANPDSIYFRDAFTDIDDNDGEEWAFRADAEYDLSESGFLRRIRVGARYADRDQIVRNNGYNNWGAPSETWTSATESRPVTDAAGNPLRDSSGNQIFQNVEVRGGVTTFADIDPALYELFNFGEFFRGEATTPPSANFLKGNIAQNYDRTQDLLRAITLRSAGSYTPLEDRACATIRTYFCPNEVFQNSESTIAGYARLDYGIDFAGGAVLDGNIGIRYVNTLDRAQGAITTPQQSNLIGNFANADIFCAQDRDPTQPVPAICRLDSAGRARAVAFANGASFDFPARNRFEHWLPSLNIRFRPNDELQFRFAASRAISRPNFGNLRAFIGIGSGATASGDLVFSSSSQNPFLEPVEATQFDLTAEWYFSRVGSLTASLFFKRLENVIDFNSQSVFELTNNGSTYPVVINGPANIDGKADIKGVELAYQQTFDFLPGPLAGLGLQATYTYVDPGDFPNGTPNNAPNDGNRPPGEVNDLYGALPLTQLSEHNVNVAGFYDRNGLYARLAYSWRSDYLISVRDCCFPFLPVYNEATGQLDGSLFYTVNDQFKIGVQVSNILNEVTRTSFALYADEDGEVVRSKRAAFINDRRYSISVRLTL